MTESALAYAASWSYSIATACFLAFALRLTLGWRASLRAFLLLAATLATALWAATGVAFAQWPGPETWLASTVFDTARYALWFVFLGRLFGSEQRAEVGAVSAPLVPKWTVALVSAGLLASIFIPQGWPFDTAAQSQTRSGFGVRLGLAIVGLMLIEQILRRAQPQARWAIKPLCVGLAGVFAFDLFYYADAMLFGRLDPNVWLARGIANALVIPFIAVATARNTGWTIEMHMSRSAVFHSTAILVSGLFLLAVATAGYFVRYFGGEWGSAVQIGFSFAALLVMAVVVSSGRFRSKLRVFVSKHFFSYRYDYREEWQRFTHTLAAESSLQGVQEHSIRALADLVESSAGALWLKNDQDQFQQASRWNMLAIDAAEPASGSLPAFLHRTGWVIDLNEYARAPERYPDLVLPDWLTSVVAAWLVVPLVSGTELIGFVVLGNPRAAIEVNWEVRDLLKAASRQAASYLGQFHATEALLEARKFDAFNRMSAFVVHDLKTLVAQLSLMLKNAERHSENPEFQRDMLTTVNHVVERMNHLMLQLRTGTTPVEKPQLTDLEWVVRRVCATKSDRQKPIVLELEPGVSTTGHQDRLGHVIGHLIQNALDATAEAGVVTIRLTREDASAVLEVIDTGIGMSPEFVRDRLFKPFETTKPAGMGIGVYESAQYVAALGGQLQIDSAPNVGTRVRVVLPAGDGVSRPSAERTVAV